MANFTFIDLFAGIGGIRIPFEELGGTCVFSSEIDKHAALMYEQNFKEKPFGDITKIETETIPDHDILLAGFPCQPFSIMGEGLGFADTRGTMFFEIERILKDKRPKAFLLENVKQLKGHDKGRTLKIILDKLKRIGYKVQWKILNALDFGLPQKRERIIIVGFLNHEIDFTFPEPKLKKKYKLEDILEADNDVEAKYFASQDIVQKRKERVVDKNPFYPSIWHENKSGNISILDYSCALRAGASYNYLLVNGKRRLTPKELLRLQGFPNNFKIVVSDQQIRKQTGNSVAVPVIRAVAIKLVEALEANNLSVISKKVAVI
ncbi:DNA (cytosine-5-)-methyltransferase [Enterococcus phoeniculicola]|uniref:Cytosine-specific methyltransferase n=1 Tax=Enterococcus phoeniculicola ATCC BAA-412 TaxID=1158610 RepID=R3U9J3_9ENTE|nr:DNA cytosine methyltransferase [Enterococcus phoeniculicola]EOL50138.1 DNA (cytosine-5-)-methyltransferase [Enterococcus phoeniculicola ATCC BAA-412]EOT70697.1 hypothetical protein I589_03557 [Enterococcus phoeniculicola ATCC BAA-412]OJG69681.1 DNA (cytosine-5-)-methyltransferase [Enterococcus phoeniculicola]